MIKVTCDFCGQRAVGKLTRLVERMDSEFPIRDDLDICNDCFEAAQQYVQRTADKRREKCEILGKVPSLLNVSGTTRRR